MGARRIPLLMGCLLIAGSPAAFGQIPRLAVEAKINGQPVKLVLDTGTTKSVLTSRSAEQLGLKVIAGPPEAPPHKPGEIRLSRTETFKLTLFNGQKPHETFFAVFEMPSYLPLDYDGLIAWSELKNNVFKIDLQRGLCHISNALPADLTGWKKWKLAADSELLRFECAQGAERAIIGIDTGDYSGVLLTAKRWNEWRAAPSIHAGTLEGAYNPVEGVFVSEVLRAKTITLGGISVADVPVTVLRQKTEQAWSNCDAVFGLFVLTRLQVIIDGNNGVLYTLPVERSSAEYKYNGLGAVFVPKDPEKSDDLVAHVCPGTPASDADIRNGDLLLKVGNLDVTKWRTDRSVLPLSRFWTQASGSEVMLTLKRGDRILETKVILAEPIPND